MEKRELSPSKRKSSTDGALSPEAKKQRLAHLQRDRQQLPVWAARSGLLQQVRAHKVVILVGETGSGKTTQIPRFLFEAGLAQGGLVACTQPRRVAAITVARRVAAEMGVKVGTTVGYTVRFEDVTSRATRVKYMTDGMLLREALLDPLLRRYKVVLLDEAHERTVNTDVLLGLLKVVLTKRPDDFRLVVMSATLNAAHMAGYFKGAQICYVKGRQFPVNIMYTPVPEDSYVDASLTTVLQVHCDSPPGDILVFLTGQEEIESLARLLTARLPAVHATDGAGPLLVAPIYASMPAAQQLRVFDPAPSGTRKVIIATNIAETSITVAGVRYVVDTGFVKARGYHASIGVDSLQVVPVSQAQARQRSGRAGREAPGVAYRLYTEASFRGLSPETVPEIKRCNLATVVLQLKALGVDDVIGFDFLDPPPPAALLRSLELLYALGALDGEGALSSLGRQMAALPLHPTYAKALLVAVETGCAEDALAVVSMVASDPPFVTPTSKRAEAEAARARFVSRDGDHVTLLSAFSAYQQVGQKRRKRWCLENFVSERAMRRAIDIHLQLTSQLPHSAAATANAAAAASSGPLQGSPSSPGAMDTNGRTGDDAADPESSVPLRRALTAGLAMHGAMRQLDGTYRLVASNQVVAIHPSSVLARRRPQCVVFDEVVQTTRRYARNVTAVDPCWLPELAPHLFRTAPTATR